MVRTQIYLTKRERDGLRRMAARSGKSQSEIIRAAVDHWLEHDGPEDRQQVLESVAGLWRHRSDLPDFTALRDEANRVSPGRRK
jgi:Arc/MetJ-type ribon-helix-helix transcriptional regulator